MEMDDHMPADPYPALYRGKSIPALLNRALSGVCAPPRLLQSVRLLRTIQAGAGGAVRPAALTYRAGGALRSGDLYRSHAPRAGLVLVPGATPLGKDEPRVTAFAQALARARFEVLVPALPQLRRLQVSADDAEIVVDAVSALSQHRTAQGSATVGVVAICYATGPAMIALLDERIRGAAHFMLAVGGYWDIEAVITFITTGCYRHPASEGLRYRKADEYGKWVFASSIAAALEDERDRRLLGSMARLRLADGRADITHIVSALGVAGRRIYELLENNDPDRVGGLLAALPRPVGDQIARLDLKGYDFSALPVRFILVHGNDDPVIPETESVSLARALGTDDLFILDSMQHVDPEPAGLGDTLKLLAAIQVLLQERDRRRPLPVRPGKSPLRIPPEPSDA